MSALELFPPPAVAGERREVRQIDSKTAARLVVEHHYLHRKPAISFAYGLYADDILRGVATYGIPPSRHLQKSACPSEPNNVIELNRLWLDDVMPRNSESWFVSRTLKMLPPRIVVSYADITFGHVGYIYRALNFNYAGWTDMDRKTPRPDYVPADPNTHSRDAFRKGYVGVKRRQPKVKYWTVTGNKIERKELMSKAGWPCLKWQELPPPTTVKA